MAQQGRGSAAGASMAVGAALVCLLLLNPVLTDAAIFNVGGRSGWTYNVNTWPNGKRFKAGDVLAFNYNRAAHNVVKVDKRSYDSCSSPKRSRVLQTGKDRVRLAKGPNYFICTFPGHCQSGMKISVNAA